MIWLGENHLVKEQWSVKMIYEYYFYINHLEAYESQWEGLSHAIYNESQMVNPIMVHEMVIE